MTKLPRKGTHARALYDYLAEGNSITQAEYHEMFGYYDLAQRIYDLQKKYGAKIKSEIRRNGRTRYAVYWMER